jgi:hypothetical protein
VVDLDFPPPPTNDDFDAATAVTSLPFEGQANIAEATTQPGEPDTCGGMAETVWYSFTPDRDGVATTAATPPFEHYYDARLAAFRADGAGLVGLTALGCGDNGAEVTFDVRAGKTYYLQAGSRAAGEATAPLFVRLGFVPGPRNNYFADAAPITALPFADYQDVTGAGVEPFEPTSLCSGAITKSVWYTWTPATTGSYRVASYGGEVDVYTGRSLADLTFVACGVWGGFTPFNAQAGTTYHLQTGAPPGQPIVKTMLEVTPPPAVGFTWSPGDPSIFDTVAFTNASWDPGGQDMSWSWNFGDGKTTLNRDPTHRFATDGDHQVTLTATAADGRTSSTTNAVHIETHDVGVLAFATPDKGRTGRASTIEVDVGNTRYPETVQVDLYKSAPNGFQQVGTLTNAVKVMGKKKSVPFTFSYVFTNDDLAMGKVTFQATATIQGNRDALPSDNTAISLPTRVNR